MATRKDFAMALLNRLRLPITENRVVGLVAFAAIEGGHWAPNLRGSFNPMNTTLSMPGARSITPIGVKAYTGWAQGIDATAKTMLQGNMHTIMEALRADAEPRALFHAVTQSDWCRGCNYDTQDPYLLYKYHATEPDPGGTSLTYSAGGGTNWTLIVGAAVLAALLGSVFWYFHTGHVPFARQLGFSARENPTSRRTRRRRGSSTVQTLIFPRSRFTTSSAKSWARRHGFRSGKVDVTDRSIRLRQRSPSGFKRMRTKRFGDSGISAVMGFR
jgi:hypothetical protein